MKTNQPIEEKKIMKIKEPALYKGIGVALSKKGRKVINKKVEDYMITKPYIYHLEDREFKESEWMGKEKANKTLQDKKDVRKPTTNQTKNSSKLVTKPKEELEELDNIIRGILFEHTDKVYGYFKSKGKDNFDDTVFVDKIKDLLLKQKDEAYKTGREDEAIECYKDLEKTI
jgi:hypothetical protein